MTKKRILIAIRIILGLTFLLSGTGKLIDSSEARYLVELAATEIFWLIEYASLIVVGTSLLELLLGAWLIWGRKLRYALGGSFALVAFFTVVLSRFWLQGMSVESCGCFGAFGGGGGFGTTLIRNGALLVLMIGAFVLDWFKGRSQKAEGRRVTEEVRG